MTTFATTTGSRRLTVKAAVAAGLVLATLTAAACGSPADQTGASGATGSQASNAGTSAQSSAPPPTAPATAPTPTTAAISKPSLSQPSTPKPVTTTPTPTAPPSSSAGGALHACHASNLAGRWTHVVGSAGMGQVASDLSLQNTSAQSCVISGYPAFTLYSAAGTPLPTHVSFQPIPVVTLVVRPGGWVHAELRYSTIIPSDGEPTSGPCEPKASYALVSVGGGPGTVRANLDMSQPICGRGWIAAKPYATGASS